MTAWNNERDRFCFDSPTSRLWGFLWVSDHGVREPMIDLNGKTKDVS